MVRSRQPIGRPASTPGGGVHGISGNSAGKRVTFVLDDGFRARLAEVHARGADGSLTPMDFELPSPPEVDFGGHGLYGTVGEYMKFIRMWLNDGRSDSGEPRESLFSSSPYSHAFVRSNTRNDVPAYGTMPRIVDVKPR